MNRKFTWLAALALAFSLAAWRPLATRAADHHSGHMMSGHMMGHMKMGEMGMKMSPQAAHFRHEIDSAKNAAAKKGHYMCCITPSCDWCMTHMGKCMCYQGVKMGMGACRECHGGWEAGQGRVPGKTKDDVRKMKTMGK